MKKYKLFLVIVVLSATGFSQTKVEREHRIRKCQFPAFDLGSITSNAKKHRFYKRVDSTSTNYVVKFKKDRLYYQIAMDSTAQIKNLGFTVTKIDIPEEVFTNISAHLDNSFEKVTILKIIQQYPVSGTADIDKTVRNAMQNLMVPDTLYELILTGKKDGQKTVYESTFDASGNLLQLAEALPVNYDHVLY